MSRLLAALAEIFASLASLVLQLGRLFVGLLRPPPSPADEFDDATDMLQAAEVALAHEPDVDVAGVARRFLMGHDVDEVCRLRPREQAWLRLARAHGVDPSTLDDDMLESYVTGRWRARGWAPLVDDRVVRAVEAEVDGMEPTTPAYA